jgi:hypothetical protein
MEYIDFVIPVKCNNIIIRTVIECINNFYKPRNIYIITTKNDIEEIKQNCVLWDCQNSIIFVDEDNFFVKNYGMTKNKIESLYNIKDENSREFGWWFQQLLKMGCVHQIENISDPYIVWDSDLVSLNKWDIYPTEEEPYYKFAILQEKAKNDWNKEQYSLSIKNLIGLDALEPCSGTYVPHHFVFHHCVIKDLLKHITDDIDINWIECIMNLSLHYYRFSEYKCIATFMKKFYPHLLKCHSFEKYGKTGIRYRECNEIIKKIHSDCIIESGGLSYQEFIKFFKKNFTDLPSYIQIEHVTC